MKASIEAGHPVTLPRTASVADGLMPVRPGDLTFEHVRRFVDDVVIVDDEQIIEAVLWALTNAKIVAEPSGAASIAAVLHGLDDGAGPVAAIVSGGNIGIDKLAELAAAVNGRRA
jgi:threonine dehydratase